jgi:polysaccharide pyruvyl transferase WcaK-like protein
MTAPRILIVGYYGRGNFGDDLLLHITYRLLKTVIPAAEISIIADSNRADYIHAMLGDVTILPPGRHGHFDLIVHGGGGVFFDFQPGGWLAQMAEKMIDAIGLASFIRLEKLLRSILRKPRTSATHRIGLGIGVGTFAAGSKRLRSSLPILADFSALWVRDRASVENLTRFAEIMHTEIMEGSDLAFFTEHWVPPLPAPTVSEKPRLGIALRDWSGHSISPALLETLSMHYAITGFIFDEHADPITQQLLADYPIHVWQPEQMRVGDFAAALATQDVILTSRAHGAICSACVGVPTVIVDIEPKLKQVHAMLPNASVPVAANAPETWEAAIEKALTISHATILTDIQKNHAESTAAWEKMQRWCA